MPSLVATKKKNLKQKSLSRALSSKSNLSKNSKGQLSEKAISYLECPCQERLEILIVDDNIFNVMTLQTIIESSLKMQTDKALNGKEAV